MVWGGYVWKDSFRMPVISATMATICGGMAPGSSSRGGGAAATGAEVGGVEVGAAFSLSVSCEEPVEALPASFWAGEEEEASAGSEDGKGARKRGSGAGGGGGAATGWGIRGMGKSLYAIWTERVSQSVYLQMAMLCLGSCANTFSMRDTIVLSNSGHVELSGWAHVSWGGCDGMRREMRRDATRYNATRG